MLRLIVDQERAQQRRPDHDPVDLVRRREIISALRFDGSRFGVVDVDATRSADEVRSEALAAIETCRHAMIAGDHRAGTRATAP